MDINWVKCNKCEWEYNKDNTIMKKPKGMELKEYEKKLGIINFCEECGSFDKVKK